MTAFLSLFDPRRIAGQIAILIVVAVAVVHAIFFTIILTREPGDPNRAGRPLQDRFAAILQLVDKSPDPVARATTLGSVARAFPTFRLDAAAPGLGSRSPEASGRVLDHVRQLSGVRAVEIAAAPDDARGPQSPLVITLSDGSRLSGTLDLREGRPPETSIILLGAAIFFAVTASLLSLWAARALTSPLTRFAQSARDFSLDTASPPLREDGPREVRTAARALNRMHARIRRLVEDRTRMLAAISHDLRTPITRLRLRVEFATDEALRQAMLRDLDQMEAMTSGALSYLSQGPAGATAARVDLAALLSTIADDFAETGRDVSFDGPARLVVQGRTDELMRAVTNLVDNAVKYAEGATITLRGFSGVAEIDVEDRGPGIPAERRDAMMRPFERGDAARTLDGASGFGLGLSIARSVAEDHGGRLALLDGSPRGLLARITLPRVPEPATGRVAGLALAAE